VNGPTQARGWLEWATRRYIELFLATESDGRSRPKGDRSDFPSTFEPVTLLDGTLRYPALYMSDDNQNNPEQHDSANSQVERSSNVGADDSRPGSTPQPSGEGDQDDAQYCWQNSINERRPI
jgi:hypothetical protein